MAAPLRGEIQAKKRRRVTLIVVLRALLSVTVLVALYYTQTDFLLGWYLGLKAFAAAVLGGIGNIRGAVLGAMVLGLINAFSDRFLAANWTNAIVFAVVSCRAAN